MAWRPPAPCRPLFIILAVRILGLRLSLAHPNHVYGNPPSMIILLPFLVLYALVTPCFDYNVGKFACT